MKYILTPLWIVLSLTACQSVSTESKAPNFAELLKSGQRSPVVVCFGDSVTGVYYHTGGRRAYTDMLAIALERQSPGTTVTAINAGISGHTTIDALARIDQDVLAHKPDLVTIMFGLNDMTRVPIDDYRKNLVTIIEKCRGIGAEVLLCTPNSIRNTSGRPISTLEEYVAVVREVATSEHTPLVDCYRAFEDVRNHDELAWAFFMSDEIHPNMDGHKLIAEELAKAVTGAPTSLADVDALALAIPHTADLLDAGKPVSVIAMPPYDRLLPSAVKAIWPNAELAATTWPVADQSLAEIEAFSKTVRAAKPDLVFIAVPVTATSDSAESFIQRYSWILNNSVGFGKSEWDCIAVSPSLADPNLNAEERGSDERARRLIRAQDFAAIERDKGNDQNAESVLVQWLADQRSLYGLNK